MMTLMKVPCLWARTSAGAWGCGGRCEGFADTLTINLPVSRQGRPPGVYVGLRPAGRRRPPPRRAGGGPGRARSRRSHQHDQLEQRLNPSTHSRHISPPDIVVPSFSRVALPARGDAGVTRHRPGSEGQVSRRDPSLPKPTAASHGSLTRRRRLPSPPSPPTKLPPPLPLRRHRRRHHHCCWSHQYHHRCCCSWRGARAAAPHAPHPTRWRPTFFRPQHQPAEPAPRWERL